MDFVIGTVEVIHELFEVEMPDKIFLPKSTYDQILYAVQLNRWTDKREGFNTLAYQTHNKIIQIEPKLL
jgi:hypothetical protein